jgi:hypothetical protein
MATKGSIGITVAIGLTTVRDRRRHRKERTARRRNGQSENSRTSSSRAELVDSQSGEVFAAVQEQRGSRTDKKPFFVVGGRESGARGLREAGEVHTRQRAAHARRTTGLHDHRRRVELNRVPGTRTKRFQKRKEQCHERALG